MRITRLAALALAAVSAVAVLAGPALAGPQPITTLTPPPAAPAAAPAPAAPAPAPASPGSATTTPAPTSPGSATTAPGPGPRAAAPVAPAPVAPPAAVARPASFELVDRGDTVEIIAHNVKAARTAIFPIRSRLEVPIVGTPIVKRAVPSDATVKLIELDGDEAARSLSVKLGFERADVKTLSRFAQAIQVGDDLHLLVPRKIPAEGASPKVPDPTLTAELAASVARVEPSAVGPIGPKPDPSAARKPAEPAAKPEAMVDAKIDAKIDTKTDPALDDAPEAKPDARLDAAPAPPSTPGKDARPAAGSTAKPTGDGKALKQSLASDGTDTWSKIAAYAAIGLAAAGLGFWWLRRRRGHFAPPASIEIIAQRSLGGKARIVWLSAGPREMIVSVTAQQVRMLGQWRKTDAAAALPAVNTYSDARLAFSQPIELPRRATTEIPAVDKPVSPAVSGILRLRGRTGQMPVAIPDNVATDDVVADELWAKEILAATGARR
jgi:hypothetical protein